MTESLLSLITATLTVFGIIGLTLVVVDTIHDFVWSMFRSRRDRH